MIMIGLFVLMMMISFVLPYQNVYSMMMVNLNCYLLQNWLMMVKPVPRILIDDCWFNDNGWSRSVPTSKLIDNIQSKAKRVNTDADITSKLIGDIWSKTKGVTPKRLMNISINESQFNQK